MEMGFDAKVRFARKEDSRLLPVYRYWMLAALWEASESADPRTQNAAVILDAEKHPREIARGRIEYPPGVDRAERRLRPPEKYFFLEHAERNAIYNAINSGASLNQATMITPWPPCSDCARAIIQSGIKKLVLLEHPDESGSAHSRWQDSIAAAAAMLFEAEINVIEIELAAGTHQPKLMRNGQLWP